MMKIKNTFETEVFVNQLGYLTIKQKSISYMDESDDLIMLSPEQAKLVILEMQKLIVSADEWWSLASDNDEADE